MKLLQCVLVVIGLYSPVFLSAQQAWTRINAAPQENDINDMCPIPGTNTIMAACNGSTIMKSNDGGLSWSLDLYPGNLYNEFDLTCVCFVNNNLGFIGTSDRIILRTTDGGNAWDTCKFNIEGLSRRVIDIESSNDTTLFACFDFGKLYKSTDAGIIWSEFVSLAENYCLKTQFLNDTLGFISCENPSLFLKTINGGQSWSETTSFGLPYDLISDFCFVTDSIGVACLSETSRFYKTTDMGNTWTEVYNDWRAAYWKIAFFDEMNGIATGYTFYGYYDILLITEDGGSTWLEKPVDTKREDQCICILDENNCIKAGYLGMMHKSTDKGINWTQLNQRTIHSDILSVQMLDETVGFAVAEIGYGGVSGLEIAKTADGGHKWTIIKGTCSSGALLSFVSIDTGYLVTDQPCPGFVKTTNGGASWTTVTVGGVTLIPDAIAFYDYNNGLIASGSKIYKTSDAGNNWMEITTGLLINCLIQTVYFYNSDVVFITATNQSNTYLLKSNDGGQTWDLKVVGELGNVIPNYLSDECIYFLNGNQLLKSFDSGSTWISKTITTASYVNFKSMSFINQDTGFIAGNGSYCNILKTIDGGNTWDVSYTTVTSGINVVRFFDINNGLAFGEKGVVIQTTSGGIVSSKNSLFEQNQSLEAFPNPFTDKITVAISKIGTLKDSYLQIFDLYGKCVYGTNLNSSDDDPEIDLQWLSQGVYVIRFATNDNKSIRNGKIVKL
jgi:photosystem II stability/assembly factor-like uncharacterized protein